MPALLIPAFSMLATLFFWNDPLARALSRGSLRAAALLAATAVALWVTLGTELLGALGAIALLPLLLWWSVPVAVLLLRIGRRRPTLPSLTVPRLDWWEWVLVAALAAIAAATGLAALLSPPNNWDSLGYHLPRQVYWLQQRSVEHFVTYAWRQLEMPPLAEFVGLHAMILSGGDRAANLIQWSAFVLVLAAVSLTARDLGAGRRGQWLAAFFAATAPMAFHQASNTRNDLLVSLWTCLLALWALRVFVERRCDGMQAVVIGSTAGLLILTKGTGVIFAAPVLALVLVGLFRIDAGRRWLSLVSIAACALAINAGHFGRNVGYFGSPLGSPKSDYYNETADPAALVANVVRNQVLHFGSSSPLYMARVARITRWLHRRLGVDIDDPRTTFLGARFEVTYQPEHEDHAGAPLHVLLGGALPAAALVLRRRFRSPAFWAYLVLPFSGFLLFCAALKLQAWHVRLQLPAFCLLAPLLGCALDLRGLVIFGRTAALLALLVLAPSFSESSRPLWGEGNVFVSDRWEMMFRRRPELRAPSLRVAELVHAAGVKSLAFDPIRDDWEYPIQKRVMQTSQPAPRFASFEGFCPRQPSLRPEPSDVAVVYGGNELERIQAGTGRLYRIVRQFPPYSIYARDDLAAAFGQDLSSMTYVGWSRSAGLGPVEGPYPQWHLPTVRWGLGPRTVLGFRSDGRPMRLEMRAAGGATAPVVRVRVNGAEVAERAFPSDFRLQEASVDFEARTGDNELVLEYGAWDTRDPARPMAAVFARLAIVARK